MHHRPAFRFAIACAAALSFQAPAQPAPSAATDAQIAAFQADMEVGCVRRGLERQQPETEVRSFCTCMTATLRAKLVRDDWQRILDDASPGRADSLKTIVGPHLEELKLCKGTQK